MTVKINVRVEGCVGHARCSAAAPEIYQLDENGFNVTPHIEVDDAQRSLAIRGMRACPERIISLEDDEG